MDRISPASIGGELEQQVEPRFDLAEHLMISNVPGVPVSTSERMISEQSI